jgi:hypothetical protein
MLKWIFRDLGRALWLKLPGSSRIQVPELILQHRLIRISGGIFWTAFEPSVQQTLYGVISQKTAFLILDIFWHSVVSVYLRGL